MIIQGEQYYIPVVITMNGTAVTSSDVSDVRIKIGNNLKSYVGGGVVYDSVSAKWKYLITEEISKNLPKGNVPMQISVKVGTEIKSSKIQMIPVLESIIKEDWNG